MREAPIICVTLRLERERREWSRLDLTLRVWDVTGKKVGPDTIRRIEKGQEPAYAPTRAALCTALEMNELQLFPERFVPASAHSNTAKIAVKTPDDGLL